MANYLDPVEAAKNRQVPKSFGVSYFPGTNTVSNATAGSIFKPGFDPDNPLGTPPPVPTPTPTPVPRLLIPAFPRPAPQYIPPPIDEWVRRYAY